MKTLFDQLQAISPLLSTTVLEVSPNREVTFEQCAESTVFDTVRSNNFLVAECLSAMKGNDVVLIQSLMDKVIHIDQLVWTKMDQKVHFLSILSTEEEI